MMSTIVIGSEGGEMKKMASTSTVLVAGSNTLGVKLDVTRVFVRSPYYDQEVTG